MRWWWAAAACAVAVFTAYISLVPFHFVRPHAATVSDLIRTTLETRVSSRTNLLANALMLMPFGFFGMGALTRSETRWWTWGLAAATLLLMSCVLSVTVEALQALVPGRTPSLADILAQTVGTSVGIVSWRVLGGEVHQLVTRFMSGSRRALELVLAGYAVLQFLLLLQPFDVTVEPPDILHKLRSAQVVLNPLQSPALTWDLLPSLVSALVLAAPVGALAAIGGAAPGARWPAPLAIAASGAFYFVGEAAQLFVRSRTVDSLDFLTNWAGACLGVWLAVSLAGRTVWAARATRAVNHRLLDAALVAVVTLYAVYNLSPFDFTWSRPFVVRRLAWFTHVPFAGYYVNPEFKALSDIFLKVSLALPLGMLFQLRVRPDRRPYGRMLLAAWLLVCAAFFAAVEVGQVFVPSRYPDNTDVLLAVFGVWLGTRIVRPFGAAAGS